MRSIRARAGTPGPGTRCTAFADGQRIAAGELRHVALKAWQWLDALPDAELHVFDDGDGAVIALDLDGSLADVLQRVRDGKPLRADAAPAPRGRGRPRLGVQAREVTLLPEQWAWLAVQPGGASLALRRLVDAARAGGGARKDAQARSWRFLSVIGRGHPGLDAVGRALFAGDAAAFEAELAHWPLDIREHAAMLAAPAWRP